MDMTSTNTAKLVKMTDGCGAAVHVAIAQDFARFSALPVAYVGLGGIPVALCSCGARFSYSPVDDDGEPLTWDIKADPAAVDEDGDERRSDTEDMNYDGGNDPDDAWGRNEATALADARITNH